ncbi:hypothetical protein CRE_29177 [Caenorhabditis remanei]|uniref:Uncharacterized protein n=1 Tax=Caenorhabditis remanei TaxID=31234 RepID=E3ND50_CAERE|nr:hypothetical protein CRE_29177 [Caenorhabditis remanei]
MLKFLLFLSILLLITTVFSLPPVPPPPPHPIIGGIWNPDQGPFGAVKDSV